MRPGRGAGTFAIWNLAFSSLLAWASFRSWNSLLPAGPPQPMPDRPFHAWWLQRAPQHGAVLDGLGVVFQAVFGLFAGMFVGCLALATVNPPAAASSP